MKKYEYKTVELKLKVLSSGGPKQAEEFESTLSAEGANGWRYVDTVPQTGGYGEVYRLKLIFERESAPNNSHPAALSYSEHAFRGSVEYTP